MRKPTKVPLPERKGETPFQRFERMVKKVVRAPKSKPVTHGTKKQHSAS